MNSINDLLNGLFAKGNPTASEIGKIVNKLDSCGEEQSSGKSLQTAQKSDKEIAPEIRAKLDVLMAEVDKRCPPRQRLNLKPVRVQSASVFDSKLGGTPYLPREMDYPIVREGALAGKPLHLLAQLNFEQLPHIDGFPKIGILQFYAGSDDDDVIGMDFDNGLSQNGFRVIYHKDIITDTSALIGDEDMPQFDTEDGLFPFKGEFLLKTEDVVTQGITVYDYRFDSIVAESYNALFDVNVSGMWSNGMNGNGIGIHQLDEQLYNAIYEARSAAHSCIGGYPFFTQADPRGYEKKYSSCDVLLFQLDSCNGGTGAWEDEIMWGDCGIANFFISAEDLAKCDFSRVLYNWDCG